MVTWRPSQLPPNVLKLIAVVLVTRLSEPLEVDALRDILEERGEDTVDSYH